MGYRTTDIGVVLPKLEEPAKGTKFVKHSQTWRLRSITRVSAGCHWRSAGTPVVRPQPDFGDASTAAEGAVKRYCSNPPQPDRELTRKLEQFVKSWLDRNMRPLLPDEVPTFEEWLSSTNYPEWRKVELRAALVRLEETGLVNKHRKVKSFVKREAYPEYKYARCINARSDAFKVFSGPIFKAIEKQLFARDEFIKKIPVEDRPKYIMDRLNIAGRKIVATDYTSFEALFTRKMMEAVEMQLYRHMTSGLRDGNEWFNEIHDTLTGRNLCQYRDFTVSVLAKRMSGEMCTSLGNSFSNLMFMLFACEQNGSVCTGVVEGDDGLFSIAGPVPSSAFFESMGLNIKLEEHDQIETASFCGLVFDPVDLVNVRDPRAVLADFGWVDGEYAFARSSKLRVLLRCKALSLSVQYAGCPIVGALADYGLRVTTRDDIRHYVANARLDEFVREKLQRAHRLYPKGRQYVEPPMRTRLLVQKLYGISVDQQIFIENSLRSLTVLKPLEVELSHPKVWAEYGRDYTVDSCRSQPPYPEVISNTSQIKWGTPAR